ncbi:MAG TPA: ribosome-associated translation inhibitor RaiA [Candidatus Dormibacteraeota bacterium]|nr:ribosome-associated translation inhibitor RaiA [Candidatus Dormibacteraeota bacterium]
MDPALRTYAVEKLGKLERHGEGIHEARVVLEDDERRVPRANAEVVLHMRHTQLVARCDGSTLQEAIDGVVDKMDRQIVRQKERIKEHKGRAAAGSDPLAPSPRHVDRTPDGGAGSASAETPEPADPVASRRRVMLRPLSLDDAIVVFEKGRDAYLLFLDGDGGELCLLSRTADGELELVVGDTR